MPNALHTQAHTSAVDGSVPVVLEQHQIIRRNGDVVPLPRKKSPWP